MRFGPISPDVLLPLRARVLRAGKPLESARFESDARPDAVHFGAWDQAGALVGCASAHPASYPHPEELDAALPRPYQLRGMAVAPEAQGTGAGAALLAALEAAAAGAGGLSVWCNARESALGFYERQGYRVTSAPFESVGVTHRRMIKHLLS